MASVENGSNYCAMILLDLPLPSAPNCAQQQMEQGMFASDQAEKISDLKLVANNLMADITRRLHDRREVEVERPSSAFSAEADMYRRHVLGYFVGQTLEHVDAFWRNISFEPDEVRTLSKPDYVFYNLGALRYNIDHIFDNYGEDMLTQLGEQHRDSLRGATSQKRAEEFARAGASGQAEAQFIFNQCAEEIQNGHPVNGNLAADAERAEALVGLRPLVQQAVNEAKPLAQQYGPATPLALYVKDAAIASVNDVLRAGMGRGSFTPHVIPRMAGLMLNEIGIAQQQGNARCIEAYSAGGVQTREFMQAFMTVSESFRREDGEMRQRVTTGYLDKAADKTQATKELEMLDWAVLRAMPIFSCLGDVLGQAVRQQDGWCGPAKAPSTIALPAGVRLQ